ncbi:MAG: VCBS repeat-containing protein [Lysobacterales bacterium]
MSFLVGLALPIQSYAVPAAYTPGAFPELIEAGVPVDVAAVDAAMGDFDLDGHADVFVAMGSTSGVGGVQSARADRLYLGNGAGAFTLAAVAFDAALPRAASSVAAADYNRDGRLDLVVAGGSVYLGPAAGVRIEPSMVYAGRAGSVFDAGSALGGPAMQAVVQARAADLDGDGDADLVLREADGTLRLWRNVSIVGGSIAFVEAQAISIGGADPRNRFAIGRLVGADAAPDIALLLPTSGVEAAGVVILRNIGGAQPLQRDHSIPLPAPLSDLVAADFNVDGRDDLVVVADAEDPQPQWSRARVLWSEPDGIRIGSERFPANGLRRVATGDVDADGLPDLIFGRAREAGPAPRDVPSLLIALNRNASFVPTSQCLGRYAGVPNAIQVGALDSDGWPDLLVMAAAPQTAPRSGPGWWRNDAPGVSAACCMAELAAQRIEPAAPAQARGLLTAVASAIDLRSYSEVRDRLFADARDGARLRQRYEQFSPEISLRMASDPAIWRAVASALSLWSEPLSRLLAGAGATRSVSADMIDAVDAVLLTLSATGSVALAQAIADERARLPAFDTLVGLDLETFRATVLPADRLFAESFETEVTP